MQDEDGQTCDVHSMSAGLDYPGVGPEHSYWKDTGRVKYTHCLDKGALAAFDALARSEGILAALEQSYGIGSRQTEGSFHRGLPLRPRRQRCGRNRTPKKHIDYEPLIDEVMTSVMFRYETNRILSSPS
jgi:hypothetical protein